MMKRSRWRTIFIGLLCLISLLGPSVCLPIEAATDSRAIHVLNRLSFGPSPGDLKHIQAIGVEAYIQEQLSPQSLQPSPQLKRRLQRLNTLKLEPMEIMQRYEPPRNQNQKP
ncbi:MAG: DUF1800 family protein, partial [Cyanobacteria bacterium P01_A01_bin.17]